MRASRLTSQLDFVSLSLSLGVFALAVLLTFTGCTRSRAPVDRVIQVQLPTEPVNLDPAQAEDGISFRILQNTMDGLFGYDGAGKLEKRLADSYRVSNDGKRYTFQIRPKAVWSDGRPIRAADFVIAIRRSLSKRFSGKMAALLYDIRGARAYFQGDVPVEQLGVQEGKSSNELVIELNKSVSYFLDVLTLPMTFPLRDDLLLKNGGVWPVEAPVTGAYAVTERRIDRDMRLDPNPYYPVPKGSPSPLPVLIRIVQDESTAARLFDSGMLDILTRVPSFEKPRLEQRGLIRIDPYFATYFLGFNTKKGFFSDVQLRKAIAGAIHRDQIAKVLGSGEKPASSWIPEGLEGSEPYRDPAQTFKSAVAATASRFKAPHLSPKVKATFDGGARNSAIMEKIQADVKDGVGIRLELSNMDWKSYVKSLSTDPGPLFRFGMQVPFNDPIFMLQSFTSHDPNNYTGWASEKYDALVDKIRVTSVGPKRTDLIHQAQRLLTDQDTAIIPIYHYVQLHAVSSRIKGFRANPFGTIRFSELSIDSNH